MQRLQGMVIVKEKGIALLCAPTHFAASYDLLKLRNKIFRRCTMK